MAYTNPYEQKIIGLEEQKRTAEKLREMGMDTPQGQMVSGIYVAPSWTQYMSQALKQGMGAYQAKKAEEGIKAAQAERQAKVADIIRQMGQGTNTGETIPVDTGAMAQSIGMSQQLPQENPLLGPEINPMAPPQGALGSVAQQQPSINMNPQSSQIVQSPVSREMTMEERLPMLAELGALSPEAANLYSTYYSGKETRAENAANRLAEREAAAANAAEARRLQNEFQAGQNELNRQNQRMGWAIAASNRPEKMVTIMDTSGAPVTIPQSQMQPGMAIYSPAAAKDVQARQAQAQGKKDFAETIGGLRSQYQTLKQEGGIQSEQNKWSTNIGAALSGTTAGQILGRIGGTKSSTARDVIRMSRPALMQSIVKASGMSAKQIDSNAELKLMLDQASDPSAGYEANMTALNNLEKRFGGGQVQDDPLGLR